MKHGDVADRPDFRRWIRPSVDQDGKTRVDFHSDLRVSAGAEDRRGAGIRVDRREVLGGHRECALGFLPLGNLVKKESAPSFGKGSLGSAENEHTELESTVHSREKDLLVLEVEKRPQTPGGRHRAEELRRRLVGGDSGGGEEPHDSPRANEACRPFDEEGVEIDVSLGKQRVLTALAGDGSLGLGALLGHDVGIPERMLRRFQGSDLSLAIRGPRGSRDVPLTGGEPFDLLELHPVPGGIADDGVEAPRASGPIDLLPDCWKGHLPGEKTLSFHDRLRSLQELVHRLHLGPLLRIVALDPTGLQDTEELSEEFLHERTQTGMIR